MRPATLLVWCALLAATACGAAKGKETAKTSVEEPSVSGSSAQQGGTDPSVPNVGMVELEVARLLRRPMGGVLVLLKEKAESGRIVPMVVGETEADALARRLVRQRYVRPLTHDLLETVLKNFGVRVIKVEIDDLQDGVFLARLFLVDDERKVSRIDARPSDSMVLALGAEAPIFMAESVIDRIGEPASEWEEPPERQEQKPRSKEGAAFRWPPRI